MREMLCTGRRRRPPDSRGLLLNSDELCDCGNGSTDSEWTFYDLRSKRDIKRDWE
jgi:hypothetical protein